MSERLAKPLAAFSTSAVPRAIASPRQLPQRRHVLQASFAVLLACFLLLATDMLADVLDLEYYLPWLDQHTMEIVAVLATGAALLVVGRIVREQARENARYRNAVHVASGRLQHLMRRAFDQWGLTPSEREVALLLIKGLSVNEIAGVRNARPGTVKSQCNAIYRKAGVRNRYELAAWFLEDLLAGERLLESDS